MGYNRRMGEFNKNRKGERRKLKTRQQRKQWGEGRVQQERQGKREGNAQNTVGKPEEGSLPPLRLHGACTAPSALLKVQGTVMCTNGRMITVQPMIDSGASGMGFVDPGFVQQCGAELRPSAKRITLADGTEVAAAGEVSLTYSLAAFNCTEKNKTAPALLTSTFIVTPLDPHQLILGVGWLEQHHVQIGFRERRITLRINGEGREHSIRPLERCDDKGERVAEAAPLQLQAITQRAAHKMVKKGVVEGLYAVVFKPVKEEEGVEEEGQVPGSDHPRIRALLSEFKDTVFGEPKAGVPRKRGVEHEIQMMPGTIPPPARPLRHQSEKDAETMKEYVENGLKSGILQPSTSPFGSMALIVKKKDGTPRVVIDYRALNEVTVKNKYPLPLMDELFDRTQGANFFTSIDLRNGFHQIAIQPSDRQKTAFRTRFGHFEYTVLPMGLCNAPGTFMQLMNQTFADMLDKSVLCFLDDILIFSKTEDEHIRHITEVLNRLKAQELYVKISKCAFMQREVAFLGHRIGADGLRVAPDKIGAVKQWPIPKSVGDIRSFLGLANFYRRFVKDYSRIALPLTELTKDKIPWQWGNKQQESFDNLKAALCTPPILIVADQSKPFVLNCDACDYAIGATLQQDHGNGLQPVAYFSGKMSDAERNYDVREKEFMALMKACLHWRHYLHGTQPFTLLTDHDSLKYMKTMPELKGRLARWVEKMQEFDFKIEHVPGKTNIVADALSRRADYVVQKNSINAVETIARKKRAQRAPESPSQRQRNIDAATVVAPKAADAPVPNKKGTIVTPSQRCTADNKSGEHCAIRTTVGHLCWNHLLRDMGLRVQPSNIIGAGHGLFAGKNGLPKDHRIPYSGDLVKLEGDDQGGPYVLEIKKGTGIDAARRNSGPGRWVNDPRGAKSANGRRRLHNCDFVLHTPPGGQQRIAAVRTLRVIKSGEELLVKYGQDYWRYHLVTKKSKQKLRKTRAAAQRNTHEVRRSDRIANVIQPSVINQLSARRDRVFERIMMDTLKLADNIALSLAAVSTRSRSAVSRVAAENEGPRLIEQSTARAGSDTRTVTVEAGHTGLLAEIHAAAVKDKEYQGVVQSPPAGTTVTNGLLITNAGQVRVPADAVLRTRILAELHDSVTGAHSGRDRMLAEVQKRFQWQGLAGDVERYVTTCDTCQRNKHSKQLKPGLLMPLPLPEEPCLHWTTDAVTGLPTSAAGYDAIQVFVDRLTKLKRFVATRKTDGSAELADTTLRMIIGIHGMPKSLVSDRDPRITAQYWKELSHLLGSEVKMSTAYHPQSDGQSEREIQTLTTALRSYVNAMGSDWDKYLPALELAFNSKVQASTGAAPFTLVFGTTARLPIDCALDDVHRSTVPAVEMRAERMKKAMNHARIQAEQAQQRMKRLADRHRRAAQLKVGDMVLLSTDHLQFRSGNHKLTARYIGPFRIKEVVNDNAMKLELPPLLEALHETFNITRLKLYRDGSASFPSRPLRLEQPPAVDADTNGVARYEVECVVAQKGVNNRRQLLVRWKGYGAEHDEWKLRSELVKSAPEVVAQYDALQLGGSMHAIELSLNRLMISKAIREKKDSRL